MSLIFLHYLNLILVLWMPENTKDVTMKSISKNDMKVQWRYAKDYIHFEIQAPTEGWVAIGFNESTALEGTYLLMGNVINHKVKVVEHYILEAGNYKTVNDLGKTNQVAAAEGDEISHQTKISFILPITAVDAYRKNLKKGSVYNLLLAYSQEDDFKHHSLMRTSVKIQL